jgi:N-acetylglucosamine kinase-like BadF-type ATPase
MDYVVGVDGGGTKTAGLLVDLGGQILARGTVGPTNYQIVGSEGIKEEIAKLVQRLFKTARVPQAELAGMALGLAGVGRPGEPEKVAAVVDRLRLSRKVVVDHDAMIALVGALGDEPGLILIAGTGSIALGRNARAQRARAGGWGYLLGDEGSGFFVAREALVAVLKAHDGRGVGTSLTERILEKLRLQSVPEIIPRVYRQGMSHDEMATLAPLVFTAAREGDAVAGEILDRAGRELGLMAAAVIARLGMGPGVVKIALVGSLFRDRELLVEPMEAALGGQVAVEFVSPRLEPVGGAAILALKEAGVAITSSILKKLEENMSKFVSESE